MHAIASVQQIEMINRVPDGLNERKPAILIKVEPRLLLAILDSWYISFQFDK